MIEIVKEGKMKKKYQIECSHCDSVLRFTTIDLNSFADIFGFGEYITCPYCQAKIVTQTCINEGKIINDIFYKEVQED